MAKPNEGRNRVVIEHIEPEIDCGRFPHQADRGRNGPGAGKRMFSPTGTMRCARGSCGRGKRKQMAVGRNGAARKRSMARRIPGEQVGRYSYTVAGEVDHF